jgi:hypothetical protein
MTMYSFKVASINEREVTTRYGVKKAYDLIGEDGVKYGFAFSSPAKSGISVGSVVNCSGENGKYGISLDTKTVSVGGTINESAASSAVSVASKQPYGGAAKVFPLPKTHGDTAIIRQNALTNAVATVADFIATQPTEKWPDLDSWTDMVITTAYKYAEFSSGQREVEAVKKMQSVGMQARELTRAMDEHIGVSEDEEAA